MSREFIGQVIEVQTAGQVKRPVAFVWQGQTFRIARILASWHDYSMPQGLRRPRWTMRRHRNYYHLETDDGQRFEIYLDRGAKNPTWVLLSKLGRPPAEAKS
ncbi:MAG: DUF6504 family protein [Phycisphaerae bacterium]